jgi:hypothetical protein
VKSIKTNGAAISPFVAEFLKQKMPDIITYMRKMEHEHMDSENCRISWETNEDLTLFFDTPDLIREVGENVLLQLGEAKFRDVRIEFTDEMQMARD